MLGSLATFGYGLPLETNSSEDHKDEQNEKLDCELQCALRVNRQSLIVDIRLKPYSNLSLWTCDSLKSRFDDRYIWGGDLLGNENYKKPGAPFKLAYENRGIQSLVRGLEKGYTLILLCGCYYYLRCHRSYIYDKVKLALSGRLPEYALGQRVMTPCGPGCIDSGVPLNVQRARNRYAVRLDVYDPRRYFFPEELSLH